MGQVTMRLEAEESRMSMKPLWTGEEIRAAVDDVCTEAPDNLPRVIREVTFDSREVKGGEVFFAIRGVRMDGHAFVSEALKRGAALAVVSEPDEEMRAAGPLLVVSDTLEALRRLGAAARARTQAKVVGVTGSVGKTTTKEMLKIALTAVGPTHAAVASHNNHWGVPLTLARMPQNVHFAVIEMGMNAPGEIAALTRLARPHVAIITQVAESHIGAFGSLEEIARAKAEIFSGLENGGTAIINIDAPHAAMLRKAAEAAGAARIITFGTALDAHVRLVDAVNQVDSVSVTAEVNGRRVSFRIGMPGHHAAMNALAVLAAAEALDADLTTVMHALKDMRPPKGRGERYRLRANDGGEILLLDESYNANPASMRAALALLADVEPGASGRRIAVLGDMLELGEAGPSLHADLAGELEKAKVDLLFAAGPLMRHLYEAVPATMHGAWRETSEALAETLKSTLRGGDVVMVKGSLGSRMMPLVDSLQRHFGFGSDNGGEG